MEDKITNEELLDRIGTLPTMETSTMSDYSLHVYNPSLLIRGGLSYIRLKPSFRCVRNLSAATISRVYYAF